MYPINGKYNIEKFSVEVKNGKCNYPCGFEKKHEGKNWCYTNYKKKEWKVCNIDDEIFSKCKNFLGQSDKKNISDECLNTLWSNIGCPGTYINNTSKKKFREWAKKRSIYEILRDNYKWLNKNYKCGRTDDIEVKNGICEMPCGLENPVNKGENWCYTDKKNNKWTKCTPITIDDTLSVFSLPNENKNSNQDIFNLIDSDKNNNIENELMDAVFEKNKNINTTLKPKLNQENIDPVKPKLIPKITQENVDPVKPKLITKITQKNIDLVKPKLITKITQKNIDPVKPKLIPKITQKNIDPVKPKLIPKMSINELEKKKLEFQEKIRLLKEILKKRDAKKKKNYYNINIKIMFIICIILCISFIYLLYKILYRQEKKKYEYKKLDYFKNNTT
jgi:hypothetical protein